MVGDFLCEHLGQYQQPPRQSHSENSSNAITCCELRPSLRNEETIGHFGAWKFGPQFLTEANTPYSRKRRYRRRLWTRTKPPTTMTTTTTATTAGTSTKLCCSMKCSGANSWNTSHVVPKSGQVRVRSLKTGRIRAYCGQKRAETSRCWLTSDQFRSNLGHIRPRSAKLVRKPPNWGHQCRPSSALDGPNLGETSGVEDDG